MAYFAIRPSRMPEHIRIEQANTPVQACQFAFGRGIDGMEFKSLGTNKSTFQSDKKRIALLRDPNGWVKFSV